MRSSIMHAIGFILITFGLNWVLAGLFFKFGGTLQSPAGMAMSVGYMFVPMLVALGLQRWWVRAPLRDLGFSLKWNRWWAVAWGLPLLLIVGALGVGWTMPGIAFSPDLQGLFDRVQGHMPPEQIEAMRTQMRALPVHAFWLTLFQGMIAGVTVNAVAALGEEIGWRGFLQRELGFMGFWRSSLLIGLIWGGWHIPLVLHGHNYPEHPVEGVFLMTDFCLLLSPLIAYVRLRARSVVAAAVFHGTLNGVAALAVMILSGGNDLSLGITGLAGLLVLAVANIGLFVYDRFLARESLTRCPQMAEELAPTFRA